MFEDIVISTLSQENAETIANDWHYPKPYDFYDMINDEEDYQELITPEYRKEHYYQIVSDTNLIAFFGIFPLSDIKIELGLGLRPNLTGKGFGQVIFTVIEEFVSSHFNHYEEIILSVAEFNQRAIKLYSRLGYEKIGHKKVVTNGSVYDFLEMRKVIKDDREKDNFKTLSK